MNAPDVRQTQADRSADMRARLIEAAIAALIESGYAKTTAVEVCRRAGVTRGALNHHFPSVPALLAAAMSDTYERLFLSSPQKKGTHATLEAWIDVVWAKIGRPEFKAVIEVWLAARNDPELTSGLQPAIDKYKRIFSIDENDALMRRVGASKEAKAFYRLACETMIGLALGRATTARGGRLAHEDIVLDQLRQFARRVER